jgi:two-component system CheB/CheR fusion protein
MQDSADECSVTSTLKGARCKSDIAGEITKLEDDPDTRSMTHNGLGSDCPAHQILLGECAPDGFLLNDKERALHFLTGVLPTTPGSQIIEIELSPRASYMQRMVEELRGANEEAQSSNEELQSTNEELQCSNEELTTTNEEMQDRNSELCELNDDLMNVLSSIQTPIVMLNGELHIRRCTSTAEKVLHLVPADIGRNISDIKPRINVPDLEDLLRRVISSMEPFEREVQHEDGRWYSLRIQPYKTAHGRAEGAVLQLLDIDRLKRSIEELAHARDYAEAIIETVREPLLVLDHRLSILTANRAFFETFRTSPKETIDRSIYELDNGQWNLPKVSQLFNSLLVDGNTVVHDIEVEQ